MSINDVPALQEVAKITLESIGVGETDYPTKVDDFMAKIEAMSVTHNANSLTMIERMTAITAAINEFLEMDTAAASNVDSLQSSITANAKDIADVEAAYKSAVSALSTDIIGGAAASETLKTLRTSITTLTDELAASAETIAANEETIESQKQLIGHSKRIHERVSATPIVWPLCGGGRYFADAAELQEYIDNYYGEGLLTFDESRGYIYGSLMQENEFVLQFYPENNVITLPTIAGDLAIARVYTSDGSAAKITWPDGNVTYETDGLSASDQPAGNIVVELVGAAYLARLECNGGFSFNLSVLNDFGGIERLVVNDSVSPVWGTINNLPKSMTYFLISGVNTTSGSTDSLPSRMYLYLNTGNNTVHAEIGRISKYMLYFFSSGESTASCESPPIFSHNSTMSRFFCRSVMSSDEVDMILKRLSEIHTWSSWKTVHISGDSAAPSSYGESLIEIIEANGGTVTTN